MLDEAQHQTGADYQANHHEMTCTLHQPFGHFLYRHIRLRNGIDLAITQWTLQEQLKVLIKAQNQHTFELSFCVSGEFQVSLCRSQPALLASPGRTFLEFTSGEVNAITEYGHARPVLFVTITIEPTVFKTFIAEEIIDSGLGKSLAVNSTRSQILGTLGWATPAMLTALHQILNCPYQGTIRDVYLEGKVLELIALKLEQSVRLKSSPDSGFRLKSDDVERICLARDILLQNIEQPPSIFSLAKQVRINDFKLKRGFRQLFGTTVFGYLRQYRMEQARSILEAEDMSVAQVAQVVGYASPSQFSVAFKKQFGFSPKVYKAACRNA